MTDASRPPREPPMSPHLSVWRWHITMATSIAHRATGVALYVGALIAAAWAVALAQGPDAYAGFKHLLGSPLGKLVMFGLTLSFFYHLANGVRHLVWDAGHGLNVKSANASSVVVFAFTAAATVAIWVIAAMTGAL
ncbi:succinate dehydrogenase, cytochrome b556 subunit [Phenylobacterium hankyongense]|uniref:Succinate dehydrogenase cytochrome b556 subunit n=1 Tax=Phenylobacterium hankyongense TaxID=1813876 RepID=A0A328AYG5_9CAUL|nr:succinate dehydrogenase, cytochrome b556 subunit [Phenylobacterium hankyongense]RAK59689.1 succinate dehydrogenase, cytochrome b556 subunit [Phenylobacterium hankyongense]